MTATRSQMCRTTARSCAMKRYVSPNWSCSSSSRLMIWAWIDTSKADTGSSQMIILGRSTRARAMPTRWRCPPENSCGIAIDMLRAESDGLQHFLGPVAPFLCVPTPWITRGSVMISPKVMRGLREAYGSWKMNCDVAPERLRTPPAQLRGVDVLRTRP